MSFIEKSTSNLPYVFFLKANKPMIENELVKYPGWEQAFKNFQQLNHKMSYAMIFSPLMVIGMVKGTAKYLPKYNFVHNYYVLPIVVTFGALRSLYSMSFKSSVYNTNKEYCDKIVSESKAFELFNKYV